MTMSTPAGWYPDPENAANSRWWDGEDWTGKRQPIATIACGRCGAGHSVPEDYPTYQCTACGATRQFCVCPDANCATVSDVDMTTAINASVQCRACGRVFWIAQWRERLGTVGAAVGKAQLADAELADPRRRLIGGLVTAASMIPSVLPNSLCILRFVASHVGVMTVGTSGTFEVCQIDYSDVELLEITGAGRRTYASGGGFIGGGFGVQGAIEGMAIASVLNALTQKSTIVRDTVVNFKAGDARYL